MMIGESSRIRKMVRYHEVLGSIDRAWDDLEEAAQEFVSFVERQLPDGKSHWATKLYPDEDNERDSIQELISDVMFEQETSPMEYAWKVAEDIDDRSAIPLGAVEGLEFIRDHVEAREEKVLSKRREYLNLVSKEERVRRVGNWEWYEAVRRVRERVQFAEGGTPIRIDRLQTVGQEEIEMGFRVSGEKTLGEAALSRLMLDNLPRDGKLGYEDEQPCSEGRGHENMEAATWAGFLHMARAGGESSLPGVITVEGDGFSETRTPEVALRN